ncbi:hypothetical protein ADUPG1_002654, partial [Aduncisulcus paluster]
TTVDYFGDEFKCFENVEAVYKKTHNVTLDTADIIHYLYELCVVATEEEIIEGILALK